MYVIDIIKLFLYFVLLVICAWTDYNYGKIYNKNLLRFLIVFILLSLIEFIIIFIRNNEAVIVAKDKLINNAIGFVIAFAIGFLFYVLGVFKGGDAKLLAIVGLLAGKSKVLEHFAIIILVAGVAALCIMLKKKVLFKRLKTLFEYLKLLILTGNFVKYSGESDDKIKFPFAVYILLGEMVAYTKYFLRG